jgi:hypothetical protein
MQAGGERRAYAKAFIERYGRDAPLEALDVALERLRSGDVNGCERWMAIASESIIILNSEQKKKYKIIKKFYIQIKSHNAMIGLVWCIFPSFFILPELIDYHRNSANTYLLNIYMYGENIGMPTNQITSIIYILLSFIFGLCLWLVLNAVIFCRTLFSSSVKRN